MSTMIGAIVPHKPSLLPHDECPLSPVVASIGHPEFAERVLTFVDSVVGADHVAAYQMRSGALSLVIASNRPLPTSIVPADFTAYEIKRQLKMVGADTVRVEQVTAQHPCVPLGCRIPVGRRQNLMIAARKNDAAFFVSIVRSAGGSVAERDIELLRNAAGVLVSAIARHYDLKESKPNLAPALTSLPEIEECLLSATDLSRRESEVCARILYGLSSYSIALDLGIGKESVMTYRKRAYLRLGIGSQRELLIWYLGLWSVTRGEAHDDSPSAAGERSSRSSGSLSRKPSTESVGLPEDTSDLAGQMI